MIIWDLPTPAALIDMDILAANVKKYQAACDKFGKRLWPMTKTHKSTAIAQMARDAGAAGFLCGTLDECEGLAAAGFGGIMY
ncbi:MAG: alanine racemase, partial [Defluviitaleaceae bacterium]|nr:alanine racemase [Defluviitaleaceae bacterium]